MTVVSSASMALEPISRLECDIFESRDSRPGRQPPLETDGPEPDNGGLFRIAPGPGVEPCDQLLHSGCSV